MLDFDVVTGPSTPPAAPADAAPTDPSSPPPRDPERDEAPR